MRSVTHRGSHEAMGLVLALDADNDATCDGLALRVEPGTEDETLAYLRERELVTAAYLERHLTVRLEDGRAVEAVTYIIDPDHDQYCGGLPLEEQAQIIARARGKMGPNWEYLYNTALQLRELGISDADLDWLENRVREIIG
jgi:cation transport protein ChaC